MKSLAITALKWAKTYVIEWLTSPEGRDTLLELAEKLAERTDNKIDDRLVEMIRKGTE